MKTSVERLNIADEIIRRVDTVAILTPAEVLDIRQRALSGEFDEVFASELSRKP